MPKANPINFLQNLLATNAATTDGLANGGAAENAKKAAAATTTTTTTSPTAAMMKSRTSSMSSIPSVEEMKQSDKSLVCPEPFADDPLFVVIFPLTLS